MSLNFTRNRSKIRTEVHEKYMSSSSSSFDADSKSILQEILRSMQIQSQQIEPDQASRQPDEISEPATIMLRGDNFLQAITDLDGCSHIWLIFGFHHNTNWKPLVQTPRSDRKIGVFATRAPYRPNPLGLSCVPLISVHGLEIKIGPNDLLDGTPIYDIKPYVADIDSVPNTNILWLNDSTYPKMKINFSPSAEAELDFLELHDLSQIRSFIKRQLEYDPTNSNKKRVENSNHFWTLSYRTWRIDFILTDNIVGILAIRSGYSAAELLDPLDTYLDKAIHQKFNRQFN